MLIMMISHYVLKNRIIMIETERNMYMIQNGFGIFSIPVDKKLDFYNNLTLFYSDDIYKEQLINFLKEFCITGYKPL